MRIGGSFDAANDPMQQFSDRIVHALFLRGDLAPAAEKISIGISRNPFAANSVGDFPEEFSASGCVPDRLPRRRQTAARRRQTLPARDESRRRSPDQGSTPKPAHSP
jgi:hypothetical protein